MSNAGTMTGEEVMNRIEIIRISIIKFQSQGKLHIKTGGSNPPALCFFNIISNYPK